MKSRSSIPVLVAFIAVACARPGRAGDCPASIFGGVIVEALTGRVVQLEWQVLEDASVRSYNVSRYDCPRPSLCSVALATVAARGPSPAGEPRTYTLIDVPPPGAWTYRLRIVRTRAGRDCIEEIRIVMPPSSCDVRRLCEHAAASLRVEDTALATEVGWRTSAESSAAGYRLLRFNRRSPHDETQVAVLAATGSCGQVVRRRFGDTPPNGEWGYLLEVFDHAGAVACRLEAPAE